MTKSVQAFDENSTDIIYSEAVETYSTWKNDTQETFTFRLLTDDKAPGERVMGWNRSNVLTTKEERAQCQMSQFLKVSIKPGQSIKLPTKYDQAIRWVSPRTGQVVGGLCPLLKKVGEEDIVIAPAFDYKRAILEQEALKAVEALKYEERLKEGLALLEKTKDKTKK